MCKCNQKWHWGKARGEYSPPLEYASLLGGQIKSNQIKSNQINEYLKLAQGAQYVNTN